MKLYIRNNSHRMKSIKIISSVSKDVIYKKKFTIIAGVNGVGKSTFVKHLKTTHSELGHIIDPDALAKEHGGNLKGGKEALKDIEYCINNGIQFTEETTLSGRHIIKVIEQCKANGYTVNMIYIGLDSPEESINRIANRVKHGGHDIPEEIVRRRYANICKALSDVLPLCDTAEFYDNENGPEKIATYSNNVITQLVDEYPLWMQQFVDYIT